MLPSQALLLLCQLPAATSTMISGIIIILVYVYGGTHDLHKPYPGAFFSHGTPVWP